MASWQGNKWPDNQHYSEASQHRNENKKNHYLPRTGPSCDVTCDKHRHISETTGKGNGVRVKWEEGSEGEQRVEKKVIKMFLMISIFVVKTRTFVQIFKECEEIQIQLLHVTK